MEDWNNTPSIEKVKSYVKNFHVPKTNIMTGVPPCAGLSSMSCKKAADMDATPINNYIYFVVKMYLASDSDVLVFENAPTFCTGKGDPVIKNILNIINANGYERQMHMVAVSTMYHGIPQNRKRTFVYLYKGDSQVLEDIRRETPSLEEYVKSYKKGPALKDDILNVRPYPKLRYPDVEAKGLLAGHYVMDGTQGKTFNTISLRQGVTPEIFNSWGDYQSNEPELFKRRYDLWTTDRENFNCYDASPVVVHDYLGAICRHNAFEYFDTKTNKFLTIRDLANLMGYPRDFQIESVDKINMMAQNIPVPTAADSILWAIQLLEGKYKNPTMNGKVAFQTQHGDFKKVENVSSRLYAKGITTSFMKK